jgi:multiple sugar transport system permease protein
VLLIGYPIIASGIYSFTDFNLFQAPQSVGWKNYQSLFTDPLFLKSVWNTVYLTVVGVPLTIGLALAFAHVLNLNVRGQPLYRAFVYLPMMVPAVVGGYLWRWLLNAQYGFVNWALELIGVPGPLWLVEPDWGKPAIILISLWTVGGTTLIYLAALRDVPKELYEAASIDGAGVLGKFRHITWPTLTPITLFQIIVAMIAHLQIFTLPYVLSKEAAQSLPGGVDNTMLTYALYLFQTAFTDLRMGYASAMAWLLFIVTLAVTSVILLTSRFWVHNDR